MGLPSRNSSLAAPPPWRRADACSFIALGDEVEVRNFTVDTLGANVSSPFAIVVNANSEVSVYRTRQLVPWDPTGLCDPDRLRAPSGRAVICLNNNEQEQQQQQQVMFYFWSFIKL